jgi:hypothetical protein
MMKTEFHAPWRNVVYVVHHIRTPLRTGLNAIHVRAGLVKAFFDFYVCKMHLGYMYTVQL